MHRDLREAVTTAVADNLRRSLSSRALILPEERVAALTPDIDKLGHKLLSEMLQQCYADTIAAGALEVAFDDGESLSRVTFALAFGAVTRRLLAPPTNAWYVAPNDRMCGIFNLGVGALDDICDRAPRMGTALLDAIREWNLPAALRGHGARSTLAAAVPGALAAHPAISFVVRLIDGFVALAREQLRRPGVNSGAVESVAALLVRALDAERRSVRGTRDRTKIALTACSHDTAVLPFQIIEQLQGGPPPPEPTLSPGIMLGEAMWRIDDLVDIVSDAESDDLNAILLNIAPLSAGPGRTLEAVLASECIATVAEEAAELLGKALRSAPCGHHSTSVQQYFLVFVQRLLGPA